MTSAENDASALEALSLNSIMEKYKNTKSKVLEDDNLDAKVIPRGMKAGSLNLYQGPPACSCCINWVEEFPDNLKESIEAAEGTQQYALLLRNRKSHKDGSAQPLELDSIVVHSPIIKKVLGEKVFKNYGGVTTTLEKLEFSAPFVPFLHRWDEFQRAFEDEQDDVIKRHLGLIYDAISKDIKTTLEVTEDMRSKGITTYRLLWTIFRPGEMLYVPGNDSMYRLTSDDLEYNALGFCALKAEFVSWDGEYLGYDSATFKIGRAAGTMNIRDLPIYPLEFEKNPEAIKLNCRERGEKFVALRGVHAKVLKRSDGSNIDLPGIRTVRPPKTKERIIIDAEMYYEHNKNYDTKPTLTRLTEDDGTVREAGELTQEEFMLCSRVLRGFSLQRKRWTLFSVDWVEDITWQSDVFDNLVLSTDHKELVLGFVECHRGADDGFDDFIEGKGRSLIFLLSGPPGVGKTLTAEAVAEKLQAPLYSVSAGELGVEIDTVESKLQIALDVAKKWDAVLLLDEADVFLEQRTVNDLQRNRLVSVFLRKLEYYEGVLFLTTNRYREIDRAFQSRIDMHLQYPDLDENVRYAVWRNFLATSKKKVAITEEEIRTLSMVPLNGRQIKSIMKQAMLLAARAKDTSLRLEHVQRITDLVSLTAPES